MTNSPERKRKSSGRSRAKLNSWSVQCLTHSTFKPWKGLGRAGEGARAASVIGAVSKRKRRAGKGDILPSRLGGKLEGTAMTGG